jgi:AcrR family transcriptional regulator
MEVMKKPRPGGRTARTQAAVFEAAATLLTEREPGSLTMTEIAEISSTGNFRFPIPDLSTAI